MRPLHSRQIIGRAAIALATGLALIAAAALPAGAPASAAQPPAAPGSQLAATGVPDGTFAGTVKAPSGKGVAGIHVAVESSYTKAAGAWTKSKSAGKFSYPWVWKKYTGKVAVNRFSGESKYIAGYWTGNGKKIVSSIAKGKSVTIAPGKKVTGITPVLATCATVSGTVKYGDKNTMVQVFNDKDNRLVTRTDASIGKTGKFTVRGLATGKYWMAAYQGNGGDQVVTRYFGTNSAKKPAKPNVIITSCKNYKGKDITGKKNTIKVTRTTKVSGALKAGAVLTASKPAFKPGTVTVTYQWYRLGRKIPGANSRTFKVSASDAYNGGISVRVTAKKKGYAAASTTGWR